MCATLQSGRSDRVKARLFSFLIQCPQSLPESAGEEIKIKITRNKVFFSRKDDLNIVSPSPIEPELGTAQPQLVSPFLGNLFLAFIRNWE